MQPEQRATGNLEEIGRRNHDITAEYRIYGPPGCGKTTNLSRQIQHAVNRYGADSVLVTSFSRTAAAELAGRDLPIAPDRIGTLHSHCWHALGGPAIAEANVDEWNRDNPRLAITPAKKQGKLDGEDSAGDDLGTEKDGDEILQRLSRFRGLMIPRTTWPVALRDFEEKWTEYKRENGLLDFTDSDRHLPARCGAGAEGSIGGLRGRGAGSQPDAVVAGSEMGRARELLHRCRRRRPDHLFIHRCDARGFPRSGYSGRPQDHPQAVVSRAPRRARRRRESDPASNAAPGERVPAAPGRRRRGAHLARRLQSHGVLHPQKRHGTHGAGKDGDVPGVLLLHAPAR